jgi:DNA excision repair protein ERCC-6
MLWELKPDCHNPLIAEAIRRNEVVAVVKSLHFRDNADMDEDGYYKVNILQTISSYKFSPSHKNQIFKYFIFQVRPIIDNINKASSKWHVDGDKYAVDEIMIPYYGRHGSKQFIHGKPIRYGFKVRYFLVIF